MDAVEPKATAVLVSTSNIIDTLRLAADQPLETLTDDGTNVRVGIRPHHRWLMYFGSNITNFMETAFDSAVVDIYSGFYLHTI